MLRTLRTIPRGIWAIAVLAFVLRIGFMAATVDLGGENYNEFGEIVKNMRVGQGYALFHFEGERLSEWHSADATPFPSAFMPPGYVLYLYPFLSVDDPFIRNTLLLLIQHIAGALLVVPVFLLTLRLYTIRSAWIAAVLAAVLPDMVASTSTWGATVFVHLLLVGVFLYLANDKKWRKTWSHPVAFGGLCGMLVLFRFEAIAFVLIALLLLWKAKGLQQTWKAALVTLLILTPWIARNTVVFDSPLLSTSLGINAYRGNNPEAIGVWSEPELDALLPSLAGRQFEVKMSDLYLERAGTYAFSNPVETLGRSAKKVAYLWSFDPQDDRAKHPLRLSVWAVLVFFALMSWIGKRPPTSIVAYLALTTIMTTVFFALARHQVLMEVALIPLAGYGMARFCTFVHLCQTEQPLEIS